ncbi:MAG: COX15/CtaA family protein [Brevundimonas sp.]|uniref:COX15/CtaA family protein n=1 Tax=Brevundimonas sp. TaxID=1871086 RepID=UPI0025C0E6BF|nr:COX15/CtaA family protein [Brevundimonas sp.]MBX3478414.1 COX15/CtaA family protein [Brevundimonas sp.]
MNRFGIADRDRIVAVWLFVTAALVFAMVVVGGATRLTGSGLSITEWKPILGAIPPMTDAQWAEAFEKYKAIPQYAQVNAGMSLGEFQGIFWWEWAHRFLGRIIGLVVGLPVLVALIARALTAWVLRTAPAGSLVKRMGMPDRLFWRVLVLLALGGLQGLVGWWMVASGLSERVDVAPERLATHLGLALVIFMAAIWTGLEAWSGPEHSRSPAGWTRGAALLLGAVFVQCLLGALVAGSKAGLVYTDWPLMNGAVLPPVDWAGKGALAVLHDQGLVQFMHRIWAYAVMLFVTGYAVQAWRWRLAEGLGASALVLMAAVWAQAALGVLTLIHAVPLSLGVLHQAGAAIVLGLATVNLWMVRRSQPRLFTSGRPPRAR